MQSAKQVLRGRCEDLFSREPPYYETKVKERESFSACHGGTAILFVYKNACLPACDTIAKQELIALPNLEQNTGSSRARVIAQMLIGAR